MYVVQLQNVRKAAYYGRVLHLNVNIKNILGICNQENPIVRGKFFFILF